MIRMIALKRLYRGDHETVLEGKHFWVMSSEVGKLVGMKKAVVAPSQPGKKKTGNRSGQGGK